ncbi:SHIRT domain-containing protein [Streptococcus sp. E29BA]|uniref:SHIRT domain-containing protein n=1 Tax=Streptococcus sp. E29BA TaxID=3278716 RepID=UPI00359E24B9
MERKHKFSIKKLSVGVVSVCIGFAWSTQTVQAEGVAEKPLSNQEHATGVPDLASESPQIPEVTTVVVSDQVLPKESAEAKSYATNMADSVISENSENATFEVKVSVEEEASPARVVSGEARELAEAPESVSEPSDDALNETTRTDDKPRLRRTREVQNEESLESYFTKEATERGQEIITTDLAKQYAGVIHSKINTETENYALSEVKETKTRLAVSDIGKVMVPILNQLKKEAGLPHAVTNYTPEQQRLLRTLSEKATQLALDKVNAEITQVDEYEVLAPEVKTIFTPTLLEQIIATQPISVGEFKTNLPAYLRGMFHLTQQYHLEEGLIKELLLTPQNLNPTVANETPLERLKRLGGTRTDNNYRTGSYLSHNTELFTGRGMNRLTGSASPADLIEKLARRKNKTVAQYFKEQTEAIVYEAKGEQSQENSAYNLLKNHKSAFLLPLLSSGKGVFVGTATNHLTIGMTETYGDLYTEDQLSSHSKGTAQSQTPFIKPYMDSFERFIGFLNDNPKQPILFSFAIDSMNHNYTANSDKVTRVWSAKEGDTAANAVRRFLGPIGLWQTYQNSQNFGGVYDGNGQLKAFESRLMHTNYSGVTLFTHEMTHANEKAIWGTNRTGQGAELYARGMFEDIDNTPGKSEFEPVFNLNTSISIGDVPNRVQASSPQSTKDSLANYQKNLLEVIMYMEALEAQILQESKTLEKEQYFNQVNQVTPTKNPNRTMSTNDQFADFTGQLDSSNYEAFLRGLVSQNLVAGQFVPHGRHPYIDELQSDQYDNVPLLESFWASAKALDNKNTTGDVSFKRKAYEVLGLDGWDAFTRFLNNSANNDLQALNNQDWTDKKVTQYQKLLTKTSDHFDLVVFKEKLKQAVESDLAILKQFKQNPTPNNLATFERATAVRRAKRELLTSLLKNDLTTSVFKDKTPDLLDIVYVKSSGNGNGKTPESPVSLLEEAFQLVKAGGKIVVVDSLVDRTFDTITKAVTIEGHTENASLTLNRPELVINAASTLKNLNLQINPDLSVMPKITANAPLTLSEITTGNRPPAIKAQELMITGTRDAQFTTIEMTSGQIGSNVTAETLKGSGTSKSNRIIQFEPTGTITLDGVNLSNVTTNGGSLELTNNANIKLSNNRQSNSAYVVSRDSILDVDNAKTDAWDLSGDGTVRIAPQNKLTAKTGVSMNGLRFEVTAQDSQATLHNHVYLDLDTESTATMVMKGNERLIRQDSNNDFVYKHPYDVYYEFYHNDKEIVAPHPVMAILPSESLDNEQEPETPKNPSDIQTDSGTWTFVNWTKETEQDTPTIIIYKGNWRFAPKVVTPISNRVTYVYAFTKGEESNFNKNQVSTVPVATTVKQGDVIPIPEAPQPSLVESIDRLGEWQFKGWTSSDDVSENHDITVTGTWEFVPYKPVDFSIAYEADQERDAGTDNVIKISGVPGKQSAITGKVVVLPTLQVVTVGTKPKVEVREAATIPVTYVRDDAKEANIKTEVNQGRPEKTTIRTTFDIVDGKAVPKITETTEEAIPTTISVGTKPLVTEEISKIRLKFVANEQDSAGHMVITDVGSQTRTKVTTPYELVNGTAVLDEVNKQTVVYEGSPRIVTVGTKPVTTQISQDLAEKVVEDSNVLAGTPDKVTPGRPKLTEIRKTYTLNKDTGKVVEKVEEVIVDAGLAPERIVGTKAMVINPATSIRQPRNYQISYRYSFENGQETNFDVQKAPLPSGKTVAENETISVPNLYTDVVIESKDATGEWKFKGWNPANEQVVSGPLTFTGTWEYKAYSIVEPSIRYEANDQLAFASQPVTILGQSGKASAFTGRLIENPTDTVIQVGTKSLIQELVGTDIPVRYVADDNIEANKRVTRIEGSPAITTTRTSYRLDGDKAVVVDQTTILSTKPAVAKEIVVGTKPKLVRQEEVLSEMVEYDGNNLVGSPDKVIPGQPRVTETRTIYSVDEQTGALSRQVTTVVTDQGLAPKRIIASKALTLAPIPSPTVPTIPQPSKDVSESYTIVVSADGKEVQVSAFDDVVYAVFLEHLSALIEAKLSEGLVYDSAAHEDNTVYLFFHHPMDDQSSGDAHVVSSVNPPVENYEITILIDGKLAQILSFDLMAHAVFLEHLFALIEVKLSEGLTYVSADYKGKAVTLSFIRPKKVTKGTAETISSQSSSTDQQLATIKPTLAVKDAFKKEMALKQHDEKSLLKGGSAAAGGSNQGESALLSSKNSQGTPLTWRNGTFNKPNQSSVIPTYQAMLPKTGASNRHLLAVGGLTLTGLTFMFISLKRRQS